MPVELVVEVVFVQSEGAGAQAKQVGRQHVERGHVLLPDVLEIGWVLWPQVGQLPGRPVVAERFSFPVAEFSRDMRAEGFAQIGRCPAVEAALWPARTSW
ncbi:hypothetical protein GCM10010191_47530 [Actinomadura vinacea]|uniref:Uncharacterized protein n=1 Tax=Actinomadura vinacea TaxID=115336 RepID=A0ABN3JG13_9ACTN